MLHRRRLGAELKRLRGSRTLEEVAAVTLISTSKLSRLENGQGVPQARDVRDLINHYEVDAPAAERLRRWASAGRGQAWWRDFGDALEKPNLETYLDFESGASMMRIYASSLVPCMLQTDEYADHVLRAMPPGRSGEQVQRMVEIRARRRELLVESADSARLHVLLDEAVLRRPVGPPQVMAAQVQYLRAASRRRSVSIQVVPFAVGVHAAIVGGFTILQYDDDIDRDIVAIESHTGERLLEQPANVLAYLRMFDAVSHKALDHDESRKFLAEIGQQLASPKEVP
jgi:Domain of unknown function (DUF5753)/Helix-turn-helix domain